MRSLWRYVRASMSLSGYMPPLCDPSDGHLLLDGGYVNNLPVSVMPLSPQDVVRAITLIDDERSLRYAARTIGAPYTTVQEAVNHKAVCSLFLNVLPLLHGVCRVFRLMSCDINFKFGKDGPTNETVSKLLNKIKQAMFLTSFDQTVSDKIKNTVIREELKMKEIKKDIEKIRLQWYGHVRIEYPKGCFKQSKKGRDQEEDPEPNEPSRYQNMDILPNQISRLCTMLKQNDYTNCVNNRALKRKKQSADYPWEEVPKIRVSLPYTGPVSNEIGRRLLSVSVHKAFLVHNRRNASIDQLVQLDDTDLTNYGDCLSGWWLLWKRWNPFASPVKVPNLPDIQSRLAYVSCVRQLEASMYFPYVDNQNSLLQQESRKASFPSYDFHNTEIHQNEVKSSDYCEYIRPPIDKYKTLQFGSFDEIKEVGYNHGKTYFAGLLKAGLLPIFKPEQGKVQHKSSHQHESSSYTFTDLAQMVCKVARSQYIDESDSEEEYEADEEDAQEVGYASEPAVGLSDLEEKQNIILEMAAAKEAKVVPATTNASPDASRQQVPPVGGMWSYAAVVRNDKSEEKVEKKYKLFVKVKRLCGGEEWVDPYLSQKMNWNLKVNMENHSRKSFNMQAGCVSRPTSSSTSVMSLLLPELSLALSSIFSLSLSPNENSDNISSFSNKATISSSHKPDGPAIMYLLLQIVKTDVKLLVNTLTYLISLITTP
ncbi:hypothetical protein C0J52_07012 [Blattella germanica]|nr:hypothetical protein C0J52_07012 [Blattella germanica]